MDKKSRSYPGSSFLLLTLKLKGTSFLQRKVTNKSLEMSVFTTGCVSIEDGSFTKNSFLSLNHQIEYSE